MVDSFVVNVKIGGAESIEALLDTGASANLIHRDLYERIKNFGTTHKYDGPSICGASGTLLPVENVFVATIYLGDHTEIRSVNLLIVENIFNEIILGTTFITVLRKGCGVYMGCQWHHPYCVDECTKWCTSDENGEFIVLNPSDPHKFEVIPMKSEIHETINSPDYRFVAEKYTEVAPHSIAMCKIKPRMKIDQNTTWCDDNLNQLVRTYPDKSWTNLAQLPPNSSRIHHGNAGYYPIVNNSDFPLVLRKDKTICKVKAVDTGRKLRAYDERDLDLYDKNGVQDVINLKATDGIELPWSDAYRLRIDEEYERTLPGILGESEAESSKPAELSPENSITIYHEENGKSHKIQMECHLTGKLKVRFRKACQKFSKVFFKNEENVPCLKDLNGKVIEVTLGLRTDAVLKYRPPIVLSGDQRKVLLDFIDKKLKNGTLTRLEPQSWASQVFLVPKQKSGKDGKPVHRFVQALVDLNKNCLFRQFEMPKPRNLLNKLPRNSRFYNFFDAADSYDSIKLKEDQRVFTAFQIPCADGNGFEFVGNTRAPQGHLNSGGSLNRVYKNLFGDLDQYLQYFCDDFIMSAQTQEELLENTIKVLERFHKVNLTLSPEKCQWFTQTGTFCNIKVENGTTCLTEKYATKILDFKAPTCTSELQTFLGLVGFVQKHILDYGRNVASLTDVLHSEKSPKGWTWEPPQQAAYEKLREGVQNPKTLHNLVYVESEIICYTDASDTHYGIVMLQRFPSGEVNIVDMVSRVIHRKKRNVSILRKEFQALILCMDCFHHIFIDSMFKKIFFIDSRALFLLSKNECRSPRIHRFLELCKNFYRPVEFRWCKSQSNIADTLTRLNTEDLSVPVERKTLKIMELIVKNPDFLEKQSDLIPISMITRSMTADREFSEEHSNDVFQQLRRPNKKLEISYDPLEDIPAAPIYREPSESTDHDRKRLYDELIDNMQKVPSNDLARAHRAHEIWHIQPKSLSKMFRISANAAKEIADKCIKCRNNPSPNRHPQIPDRPHMAPLGPGVVVSMDILHLTPSNGYKYLLVTLDDFSRFTRIAALKRCTSIDTFNALYRLFSQSGLPCSFKSDCGSNFVSAEFKGMLAKNNCLLKLISVGRSNANRTERLMRVIRAFLNRITTAWHEPETIYQLQLFLNTTTNLVTDSEKPISPYELEYSIKPPIARFLKCRKPELNWKPKQSHTDFLKLSSSRNEKITEPRDKSDNYKVGHNVHYRKFGRKAGTLVPGKIEKIGDETVTIRNTSGNLVTRNFADVITRR